MSGSPDAKVGVADRERALSELSQHLGAGRLSLTEFDERCAAVLAADTKSQLAEMFTDLPAGTPPAAPDEVAHSLRLLAPLAVTIVVLDMLVMVFTGDWPWLFGILGTLGVFAIYKRRAAKPGHGVSPYGTP